MIRSKQNPNLSRRTPNRFDKVTWRSFTNDRRRSRIYCRGWSTYRRVSAFCSRMESALQRCWNSRRSALKLAKRSFWSNFATRCKWRCRTRCPKMPIHLGYCSFLCRTLRISALFHRSLRHTATRMLCKLTIPVTSRAFSVNIYAASAHHKDCTKTVQIRAQGGAARFDAFARRSIAV